MLSSISDKKDIINDGLDAVIKVGGYLTTILCAISVGIIYTKSKEN